MTAVHQQIKKLRQGQTVKVRVIGKDHRLAQYIHTFKLGATYEMVFDRSVIRLAPFEEVEYLAEEGKMPKQIVTTIWGRGLASQVEDHDGENEIMGFGFADWLVESIEVIG